MSKLRSKSIAALAVLLCAMLALSTAFLIPDKTANAARNTSGGYWTIIGSQTNELYMGTNPEKPFNGDLLSELYKALTGEDTIEGVETALSSSSNEDDNGNKFLTSNDFRTQQSGASGASTGKNVSVWLGGFKWDATYLTTSTKGDIVLDLWLSSDNTLLETLKSKWANNYGDKPGYDYPGNMYSTSYIRNVTLNAGGYESKLNDAKNNTIIDEETKPDAGNEFIRFTMANDTYQTKDGKNVTLTDSLIYYIVTPANMSYQKGEYSIKGASGSGSNIQGEFNLPNDAWDKPAAPGNGSNYGYGSGFNYTEKDKYGDWKNDYLWLPSMAETGRSAQGVCGIWKANDNLRANGIQLGIWLRSGLNYADKAVFLTHAGVQSYNAVNNEYTVRPAIHFNLTKAAAAAVEGLTVPTNVDNVYDSEEQDLSKLTVKPDWYIEKAYSDDMMTVEYVGNMTDVSKYTVNITLTEEGKNNYFWRDYDTSNDKRTFTYEITKKQISITSFTINDNKPEAHLNPLQICKNDTLQDIEAKLYYTFTSEDGVPYNEQPTTPGKYKVTVKIEDCNYSIVEQTIDFTVNKKKPNFDAATDLKWIYTNKNIDGGAEKAITSGGSVTYNGEDYIISLEDGYYTKLAEKGLKVDGFSGDLKKQDASNSAYTATVKIVALDKEEYDFEDTVVEFKWYIEKATFYLSSLNDVIEWSYTARGEDYAYTSAGAEYEGGASASEDGYIKIYISGGLPTWLTPKYDEISCKQREVGSHTAKITSFTSTNNNYNLSEEGANWLEYGWQIVARTLSVDKWTTVQYTAVQEDGYGYVTVAPVLITLPYSPALTYKYYKTNGGEEINFGDLKYADGQTVTYYVEAVIAESDAGNWILSGRGNPHGFEIGKDKQAVEITITAAGGEYDGTAKEAVVEIVGTVPGISINSFDIIYYKSGSSEGSKVAPKDAGNYYVEVTLKEAFTETYYIKSTNVEDFVITKRVLKIPQQNITLTYDGTVRDVATICGLDEGWENYIDIEIAGMGGNTDTIVKNMGRYSVTLTIKDGINKDTRNVEWDTDSSAAKTVPQYVYITVEQLVLNAREWYENGYYSRIQFDEGDFDEEDYAEKFVVYKVYDEDGKEVDYATVRDSMGMMFIVEVSVDEIHGENVIIVFAPGVTARYEFFTTGGQEPVKVELPTIADLIFNGKSQTFKVNYGEFEDYIEIDLSQSDPSVLTQFNKGEYKIYFKIKSGKNAVWAATGERKAIEVTFEMKPLILEDPQIAENQKFTYTGSEQSAILNIDAAILAQFLDVEGDISAINAGEYHFTLSIKESFAGNVVWKSATSDKSVDWTIEKAKISVKWTDGDVPELDLPEEFKDLDVEYEIKDENGNVVTRDQMEAGGKYTITAKLADGSEANYEFVDDSGKPLATPTKTDGMSFQYKSAGSSFPWWIIALIAGVLALLAVLIIVIVKRRQVADGEDEYDDYYDDEYNFDEEEIEEDEGDDYDF